MPPTVDVAAQMFMQASREYFELVPVLKSFPGYLRAALPDNERTRTVRRVAVLSASLGRKFITRGESVHMPYLLKLARDLDAPFRLAITGTPMENSLTDLWALLEVVVPGLFPSHRRFREAYVTPIESGEHSTLR